MMSAKRTLAAPLFSAAFLLMLAAPGLQAQERFDWMPPESVSADAQAQNSGGEQIIPEVVITPTPKATADASKYTKIFQIDLKKYGIHNDGTDAAATSKGINQALQDAKAAGANHIIFPKGTYLISETDPVVIDLKNTIIDLNGATLQINTNGQPKYSVVEFVYGAEGVRLTNGTLRGDRDTHDYKTIKGTHEGGAGLRFISGHNLEVDHLTLTRMTGDGAVSSSVGNRTRPELLARIMHVVYDKQLESGGFDTQGRKTANGEKTRSIAPYDLTRCNGQFELGYTIGYEGYPAVKDRVYQAYFYDPDMKFLQMKKCLQYKKTAIPKGAKFMHLEFNQPTVKGNAQGTVVRITNFTPPTDVHFHDNVLSHDRRLGLAYCGGQKWIIENNTFADNGGTAPAYGVDFEDGWELMQDVVFRNNTFHGNQAGDLVVCAGSELIFEGNTFEKNVVVWGRTENYTFRDNRFNGGTVSYKTRSGVASMQGNQYKDCTLAIVFDNRKGATEFYRPLKRVITPPVTLTNETLTNVNKVTGTYFDFVKSRLTNVHFIAGEDTRLARFKDSTLQDVSLEYQAQGPKVNVLLQNIQGTLKEEGPGLNRKTPTP